MFSCSSLISPDSCHKFDFKIAGQIFNRFSLPASNVCAGQNVSVYRIDSGILTINTEHLEGV